MAESDQIGLVGGCASALALATIVVLSFVLTTYVSEAEVARSTSPGGVFVARVVEVNGGATTDFSYEVEVARNWPVRFTHHVAGFYGAHRSQCSYGVKLRWIGDNTLVISYFEAKSANVVPSVALGSRRINVISRSGVEDSSARCGGMEYSQRH